jgi:hypothetical protein
MDLQNQFKDLKLDDNLDKEAKALLKKAEKNEADSLKVEDDSDHIISQLETRLKQLKAEDGEMGGFSDEEENEDENEPTFYEKAQPFIWPVLLTLFAIIFAALFLFFFSRSRLENAVAITNTGNIDPIYVPPPSTPVIVIKEEPLTCVEPQFLSEDGTKCLDPEPEPEPEPEKILFEDGTTTIVNVRFSYDKFNYDNYPRGIYLLEDQVFDGEFADFKLAPTNRPFANDHFFGVDRYTVSLIGSCSYVVDEAKILVKDVYLRNKYFTGNVLKVVDDSKPRVDCKR